MQIFRSWPAYALARILPAAIGFGGVALYTRLLDPASFGTYALLLSIAFLISMVGYSWLRVASLRIMAAADPRDEPQLAATIAIAFAAVSVVVCAVILLIVRVYNPKLGWAVALLTAACAVLSGWFELNIAIALARLKVGVYGLLQTARALGALLSSVLLVIAGFKAAALLGGFAIGNCAAFGAIGVWRSALRGRFDRTILKQFFDFGWPSSASSASYLSSTFQRFALDAVGGSAAVGIFAAASDFSQQTVGLLVGTATLAGQPLAFRARDLGTTGELSAQLRNNAQLVFGVGLPAAAGLAFLAGPISQLYLGSRFHVHSGTVVAVAAFVMFFSGLRGNYFEQAFEIARKTRAIALNTVVRVVLTIGLSLWAIGHYGAVGAAVALLFAEGVGLALSIVWARQLMHVPIPVKTWGKICLATAAMIGAIALVPGRYTVLGLIASVLVGATTYGAAIALTHVRRLRMHVASFRPAPVSRS